MSQFYATVIMWSDIVTIVNEKNCSVHQAFLQSITICDLCQLIQLHSIHLRCVSPVANSLQVTPSLGSVASTSQNSHFKSKLFFTFIS